ncbi:AAA family ATPase [Streptococcus sp. sy010]|uniref:AAA family ATPase n=1 Tax=Streptococcus sp. sy010 TaxID=2600148 RepID=UPI0011B3C854|nr:AAA family ATPase [Streptococcus sp. sy010]TWT16421.1 AAA family ATPase [Streptococcus sp. sy010]
MDNFKRKKELNINDNKNIIIESVHGISIKNFRLLENQEFTLGKHITVVSGRNGTMKSTIMGLIAHPFETDYEDITEKIMKTAFSEVFKLSLSKDTEIYNYDIKMNIFYNKQTEYLVEPVKMYRQGNRFRLVPSGRQKGDGFFNLPSVYINLKRLFPLVEIDDKELSKLNIQYTSDEKEFITHFYETIFGKTDFTTFQTYKTKNDKINKNPIGPGPEAMYDISSISSGEDNLSYFIKIMISFMRIHKQKKNKNEKGLTGLLSIDEFEASLHPIAQLNLFNFLFDWSRKYNVQILLNTHSLYLIKEVMKMQDCIENNSIRINFITKRFSKNLEIYSNPGFKFTKEELTLTSEETVTPIKINILCEDTVAEKYMKQILLRTEIRKRCEFIPNVTGETGSSWKSLKSLAINGANLLSDTKALIIFDADISSDKIGKTKYDKILYLPSLTNKKLPLEKEIVNYILSLPDDDNFFTEIKLSKEMFKQKFSTYKIRLEPQNIEKEKIDYYKNWYNSVPPRDINKYIKCMIKKHPKIYGDFQNAMKDKINEICEEHGIPTIK